MQVVDVDVVFELLSPYWQVLNLKTEYRNINFNIKSKKMHFLRGGPGCLSFCLLLHAFVLYWRVVKYNSFYSCGKGFGRLSQNGRRRGGLILRRRTRGGGRRWRRRGSPWWAGCARWWWWWISTNMMAKSVHMMGRLYKKMMMDINKYDGNISTYDGQVVHAEDDYEYQQIW